MTVVIYLIGMFYLTRYSNTLDIFLRCLLSYASSGQPLEEYSPQGPFEGFCPEFSGGGSKVAGETNVISRESFWVSLTDLFGGLRSCI